MFSRRGLFKYLPAFLVPATISAESNKEVVFEVGPETSTGITHEQLQALAMSLPLPELKILIENLDQLSVPRRDRRKDEPLHKFQYQFPSGGMKTITKKKEAKEVKNKWDFFKHNPHFIEDDDMLL